MSNFKAYLQLLRPPNLVTALTDILAGFAVAIGWSMTRLPSGLFPFDSHSFPALNSLPPLLFLLFATLALYGGGVVLNDYYDADLDSKERPERPIPSGRVPKNHAAILGYVLLLLAVVAGFLSSKLSGVITVIITLLVILYDTLSKHHTLWGPLNMGLCRGCNLLLGISFIPALVMPLSFLSVIPVVYIAAITLVSRGEVSGGTRGNFYIGLFTYLLVGVMIISLGFLQQNEWIYALPFVIVLYLMVIPPLLKALTVNQPQLVGRAVKMGVLAIIPLNAALAAGFTGWIFGLLVLLLLPLSILLAKIFAVT